MKLELKSLAQPFQWAYHNPRRLTEMGIRATISGGLLYMAYRQGERLFGTAKSVQWDLACSGELFGFTEQLVLTASVCLASVMALRYSRNRILPQIAKGHSER